jgi:hypothetical protein
MAPGGLHVERWVSRWNASISWNSSTSSDAPHLPCRRAVVVDDGVRSSIQMAAFPSQRRCVQGEGDTDKT